MRTMGGYGKTCGFLHFPFWEKMKHQFRSCFALTPRCFIFSIELLPRVKERKRMLEPIMPEYDHNMYLKGFTPTQIYSAFKQTQRRKRNDDKKKKREESILEKETMAFIEAMLMATTKEAMKEIFKDFKI